MRIDRHVRHVGKVAIRAFRQSLIFNNPAMPCGGGGGGESSAPATV